MDAETNPRLALVVPIHGQLEVTRRFLASFERQTVRCPLVFVDDASPDDSVDWLRAHGWEVYVPAERLWYNGVVNWALDHTSSPYLGVLNNDLVLGRYFVEEAVRSFEETRFDLLVPQTVPEGDPSVLDRRGRRRVRSLWRQEGWCMLFRVAAVRRLPPIPVHHLRLWFGDTWLFHHAWAAGLKVGVMRHNRVFHAGSVTIKAAEARAPHPIIAQDHEHRHRHYPWLDKRRPLGRLRRLPRPLRKLILPYL